MRIAVIGTGYVGLVTGVCFSELGNEVICVDVVESKIELLKKGLSPIFEPGLDKLLRKNIRKNRIIFTTNLKEAVDNSEVIFLALPTPPSGDGSADLSAVIRVSEEIGKLMNGYRVIVNKSTVPVGTAHKVHASIRANFKGQFDVVSNPEFLKEGFAVDDFLHPDRVVVGVSTKKAESILKELYEPLTKKGASLLVVDTASSEMIKYAANSFLATKITFANEVANLCEKVGANVVDVMDGVGLDTRIGRKFLNPGIGYGGSCFPKDVDALIFTANEYGSPMRVLEATAQANTYQKSKLVHKIREFYNDNVQGKKFALWGLAFKPNTDDVREAPAQTIIKELRSLGADIVAYDPEAIETTKKVVPDGEVEYSSDKFTSLKGCDALIIATEWDEFIETDPNSIKKHLIQPVVFDGRNIFDPAKMMQEGFYYTCIGRKTVDGRK